MNQELTVTDRFKQQIEGPAVQEEFSKFIQSDSMQRRFTAVAIRVVTEKPELLDDILQETEELIKIFVTSIKTAEKNKN